MLIMPHCSTYLVHLTPVLNKHVPVFDGLNLNLSGDAVPLAVLTPKLNAVGVPIDVRIMLSNPGDW
jgi:hypothetical protein